MTDTVVFPEPLFDLRTWLRVHPLLAELTAENVFFRLPPNPAASPFMRISQVGGGTPASEAPILDLRVSHEVWGLLNEDYLLVRQTIQALNSVYQHGQNALMGTSTVLLNARVTGTTDSPDPDTGWPRVVMTADLTVSLS